MSKPRYYVFTWDGEKQKFTPQAGVRCGPYSKWGLRKAIRALRRCGYSAHRLGNERDGHDNNDFSVLIERDDERAARVKAGKPRRI